MAASTAGPRTTSACTSAWRPTRRRVSKSGGRAVLLRTYPDVSADHIYRVSEDGSIEEVERRRACAITLRPAHLQQGDGASVVHLEELRHRHLAVRVTAGGGDLGRLQGRCAVRPELHQRDRLQHRGQRHVECQRSQQDRVLARRRRHQRRRLRTSSSRRALRFVSIARPRPACRYISDSSRTQMSVPFDLETLGACN